MYDEKFLEKQMTGPMRKTVDPTASSGGQSRFPPEAYQFNDDVTAEAVASLRNRASAVMEADEWEVVDGFGLCLPA